MELEGIKIGYAFTGSFCTLARSFDIMEQMVNLGADVTPIMSDAVYSTDTRFGKASDFIDRAEEICKKSVMHLITETETIGPKNLLDMLIVVPCTSNTIGKLANGINDTSVTMAVKATVRNGKPIVIGVSTNELVIIELSRENLVKSRVLVLSSYFISLRANTNSFKSQNIIMEGCANDDKNNRSMQ